MAQMKQVFTNETTNATSGWLESNGPMCIDVRFNGGSGNVDVYWKERGAADSTERVVLDQSLPITGSKMHTFTWVPGEIRLKISAASSLDLDAWIGGRGR